MEKRDYSEYSREDLVKRIKQLEKKKFGLIWEEKPEEIADRCKSEIPILNSVEEFDIHANTDPSSPTHIMIEGDNYHALHTLHITHKGKVDFIYIDPPYNTGARDWKYNNDYVDLSDPYRHSKWLSFMSKRLRLCKPLLKDDGVICVTIDDNEMPRLWNLMESIFGEFNHLGTVVIRNNPGGRKTKRKIALNHEYALFFGKSNMAKMQKMEIEVSDKSHVYLIDDNGNAYEERNLRKDGVDSKAVNRRGKQSERYYPIYVDSKTGKVSSTVKYDVKIMPIDTNGEKRIWRRAKNVIDEMYEDGRIFYKKTKAGDQIYFKFYGGTDGEPFESIWYDKVYSASEYGTKELNLLLGKREAFQYPKSPYAVKECIRAATSNPNAVVLDFFAGSGTTGQAVLEMNIEEYKNMQFILVTNNENNICYDVFHPRIKAVIDGVKDVDPIPANVKYYKADFFHDIITDQDKRDLVLRSTEMLCLAENCFELETDAYPEFKLYKGPERLVAIIYDEDHIQDTIKALEQFPESQKLVIYVFSYDADYNEEDFESIKQEYVIKPIPEIILNTYKRISRSRQR